MVALTRWAAGQAGVRPEISGIPDHVEVSRRGHMLLLINHGWDDVRCTVEGIDPETGQPVDEIELRPLEWRFLTSPPDPR
jgi:beta-galactosidase